MFVLNRRTALGVLAMGALTACVAKPDSEGWFDLGDTRVRVWAGDLGPGCRLTGDPWPAEDLDTSDPWRGDPATPACDAYIAWEGVSTVAFSGPDGGLHPAYESVGLQPLFIRPGSAYLHMQEVTRPGGFVLPLVLEARGVQDRVRLRVEALDPEG